MVKKLELDSISEQLKWGLDRGAPFFCLILPSLKIGTHFNSYYVKM